MEANQKKKFICKFCNKRYPCGKSLGGHIRIHLNGSSAEVTEETNLHNHQSHYVNHQSPSLGSSYNNGSSIKRDLSVSYGEALVSAQSGYILRENPKKTKKFVFDLSNSGMLQDKVCKECGKGFQSLKALCGHMACHSRNNNNNNNGVITSNLEDHYSVTSEKLKELVTDDQSDTETSAPTKRRRSDRCKSKTRWACSSSPTNSFSSMSDVEQEQEEVAKCLMLLSKDSSFKGCLGSAGDSSDNYSTILETKSCSAKSKRAGIKNFAAQLEFEGNPCFDVKNSAARDDDDNDTNEFSVEKDECDSENSDSAYFTNGPRKVCDDRKNVTDKAELESGFGSRFDSEMGKRLSRFRRIKTEFHKSLGNADSYEPSESELGNKSGFYDPKLHDSSDSPKRVKSSGLVEHQSSQKRTSSYIVEKEGDTAQLPSSVASSSKNLQSPPRKKPNQRIPTSKPEKKLASRKGKMHECPFCSKVFRSGQALGGHKRSHFVGSSEERTLVIKDDGPNLSISTLIDLNLPAPTDEEVGGLTPW